MKCAFCLQKTLREAKRRMGYVDANTWELAFEKAPDSITIYSGNALCADHLALYQDYQPQ